ncbi:MAG: MgtC/SapB family protein [Bdellovibrionales bacterium]
MDLQPYLISLVVGFLVGLERERNKHPIKAMGLRTITSISLLGAVAGGLEQAWMSAIIAIFALSLILISYAHQIRMSQKKADWGLTTEFAAVFVFCLGYISHTSPVLSALLGPVLTLMLFSKTWLHRFTKALTHREIEAALILFLAAVVVLNLVPDATLDPWGIFNPRKFGYLILTLGILEFGSYVLVKSIGENKGVLIAGFLGGLVSSTAVMLSSARRSQQHPELALPLLKLCIVAKIAALLQLLLIVGLISLDLVQTLVPAVGAALVVGTLSLFVISRRSPASSESPLAGVVLRSPLDLKGVLRLSLLLALILGGISLTKRAFGEEVTFIVTFLTALFELHGVSLATATLFKQGATTQQMATISLLIAIAASLIAKIGISWLVARGRFSKIVTLIFLAMATASSVIGIVTF